MIDLGSLAGPHEHDHELRTYCLRWDRWSVLPLAELSAKGKGSMRPQIAVRCRNSGEVGRFRVRSPVPTLDPRRAGWISPH